MAKDKQTIKYSGFSYIIVRRDDYNGETDVSLYSFGSMKNARDYAETDIQNTMSRHGVIYSKTCRGEVEYSKFCGNPYWFWTNNDNLNISWEIRKLHTRTTSKWDDPCKPLKWESAV